MILFNTEQMMNSIVQCFSISYSLYSCSAAPSKIFVQAFEFVSTSWLIVNFSRSVVFGAFYCIDSTLYVGGDGGTIRKTFFQQKIGLCCVFYIADSVSAHVPKPVIGAQLTSH